MKITGSKILRGLLFVFSLAAPGGLADSGAEKYSKHLQETQNRSSVQPSNGRINRPIEIPCPKNDKHFDISLTDYHGNQISMVQPDNLRPTLVVVAGAESKDRVLSFLAEFAKPIWEYKKTHRIYEAVREHSGGLIYDSWNDSFSGAWKKFKNKMGKLDDLNLVILADARPLYQDKLDQGLEEAGHEREKAIQKGKREGAKKGASIGAEEGKKYGFPLLKNWIGLMEGIGRKKGSEEGSRRGAQLAKEVADTFIPPFVVYMAEKELLKKSEDLLPSVHKILEDRLVKNFEQQCSLGILINENDFSKGATKELKEKLIWANGYMPEDRKMDVERAIQTHQEFLKETNSAEQVMTQILGKTEPGFHVALLDPNGNTLKSWSDGAISPIHISSEYLKYWEHLQGIKKINGCP